MVKRIWSIALIVMVFCGAFAFAGESGRLGPVPEQEKPVEQVKKTGREDVSPSLPTYAWNRQHPMTEEDYTGQYYRQPDLAIGHMLYFDFLVKPTGSSHEIQHSWFYLETYEEGMEWDAFLMGMLEWDGCDVPENAVYFVYAVRLVDVGAGEPMMPEKILWHKCYVYELVEDELVLVDYVRYPVETTKG